MSVETTQDRGTAEEWPNPLPRSKTQIVATIGPACADADVIERMIRAGMNVARLNFSHGDLETHRAMISMVRSAAAAAGRPVAVMADLPGPKMRIGEFAEEPVELQPDDPFTLTTREIVGNRRCVSVAFDCLPRAVRPGNRLFLNDGAVQLEVVEVRGGDVVCTVLVGGELRSRKGLNLPGIDLGISAFTDRDRELLAFAIEQRVDAVSQSFVETADDVRAVRDAAREAGGRPFVIAKIERATALDHIDEILDVADGIMIARGDLGVEIPIERIAVVQKQLMRAANLRGTPVITATQMLESMTQNRRPTRAEVTDVTNAILDGTDCVMLSGESAMGKYPVTAVAMLGRIAAVAEPLRPAADVRRVLADARSGDEVRLADVVAASVEASVERVSPAVVVVPSRTGGTARSIARFRLPVWIIAFSAERATCRGLLFSYGVFPVHKPDEPDDWSMFIRERSAAFDLKSDLIVLAAGPSAKRPEDNVRMEILDLRGS